MRGFTRLVWRDHDVVVADAAEVDARRLQLADVIVYPPRPTLSAAAALAAETLDELVGCTLVIVGVTGRGWLVRGRRGGYLLVSLNRASRSSALGSPHSE